MGYRIQAMGVVIALASSAALAQETQVVSASAGGLAGGSSINGTAATYTAGLGQFDSSLGTLTNVDLAISARHFGEFNIVSNASGGGYIIFYIDYSFEVNGFGGTDGNLLLLDWVNEPTVGSPFGSAPGHFNTGFVPVATGTAATETFGTQLDFANSYSAGDSEFSQFIGNGTLDFDITDWSVFSLAVTGQSVSWELSSEVELSVEATYTYIVPAAGTLPLLAVSGLLAVRRRR